MEVVQPERFLVAPASLGTQGLFGYGGSGGVVFVGRRRKRSEIIETTFAVGTDFAGSRLQVRSVDILLRAGIFLHLITRGAEQPCALIVNGLRVELRIDDGEFEVQ